MEQTLTVRAGGKEHVLLPASGGAAPDWITEKMSLEFAYSGPLAAGDPELAVAGVVLIAQRWVEADGQLRVQWGWKTDYYAGRLAITLALAGGERHEWVLVTDPDRDKLETEQFDIMVKEILEEAETCFALSPVTRQVTLSQRRTENPLIYLQFARTYMPHLQRLMELVLSNPYKALVRTHQFEPIETARFDSHTAEWLVSDGIASLEKEGDRVYIPGLPAGYIVRQVQVEATRLSIDVYENQLVARFLSDLRNGLAGVRTLLQKKEPGDTAHKGLAAAREAEAGRYIYLLTTWLETPLLRHLSPFTEVRAPSAVLLKHPAYSRIYQMWRRLGRMATAFDTSLYELPLDQTWQLYEYWCYMMVVRALREANLIRDARPLFRVQLSEARVALALAPGRTRKVKLHGGHRLIFKPSYVLAKQGPGSYTSTMEPDIAIELYDGTALREVVVLDPKYRVEASSVTEALVDMHKYRDGILRFPDRTRVVRRCTILTPQAIKHMAYTPAYQEDYQLGALALTPGDPATLDALSVRLKAILAGVPAQPAPPAVAAPSAPAPPAVPN